MRKYVEPTLNAVKFPEESIITVSGGGEAGSYSEWITEKDATSSEITLNDVKPITSYMFD